MSRFLNYIKFRIKYLNNVDYWKQRVAELGTAAVVNQNHTLDSIESLTRFQIEKISPFLKEIKLVPGAVILDYGCGSGRFSDFLLGLTNRGIVYGCDPIEEILPESRGRVKYIELKSPQIPLQAESVDMVFVCLVIGGIENYKLKRVVKELNRVLKKNGTIFLIEHIAETVDGLSTSWIARTKKYYVKLFNSNRLRYRKSYFDCDQEIGIFEGQKY